MNFSDEELLMLASSVWATTGADFRAWSESRKVENYISPTVYTYQKLYKKLESEIIKRGISIELP